MKIARVTSDTRNFYLTYSAALQPSVAVATVRTVVAVAASCGSIVNIDVVNAPTQNPVDGRVGLHGPVVHVTC